jgi:hypothetical protein
MCLLKERSSAMAKRLLLSVIAVFLARPVPDFAIHGVLPQPPNRATAELWHPMAETNMSLMYFVTLLPIPLTLAWSWFIGSRREATAAGAIAASIVRY